MKREPIERHTALTFAQSMLDAVEAYEALSGDRFDPTHPNARDALRSVAARSIGGNGYKGVCVDYRRCIDGIIDRLLAHPCWTERLAVAS